MKYKKSKNNTYIFQVPVTKYEDKEVDLDTLEKQKIRKEERIKEYEQALEKERKELEDIKSMLDVINNG